MSTTAESLIFDIRNLSLCYVSTDSQCDKLVFENVNLQVKKNAVTAIMGPSGCGKSSFLMCLNRLVELHSKAKLKGKILYDGEDIHSENYNTQQLRREVGMIFQRPTPFSLSIWNNLALPLKEHTFNTKSENEEIITETLKSVGLWNEVKDRLHKSALKLSGGQQQRLCLARSLVLKPKVLLMDEPMSALDPVSSLVIEELVENFKGQLSIVLVTHNIQLAKRLGDELAFFWYENNTGTLLETGTTEEIFIRPQHKITRDYVQGLRG